MKNLGIIRKLDDLGRIVIPRETRKAFDINEGDSLEIYTEGNKIILKKVNKLFCTECGQDVDKHDSYCRFCGTKL